MNHYDLIVLGGGPGGYVAAIRAAKQGKKTLLIEAAEVGGTCLNRGCIPTKALLHTAELYRDAKRSEAFGVVTGDVRYDFARMALHKDAAVKRLRTGVTSLLRTAGVTVLQAFGELAAKDRVTANGETYSAPNIILATGSTPVVPPIPGAECKGVLTSDGVLALEAAPESVVIVGGGVIGMEFASLFSMLEIPVTILEALPEVLAGFDRDAVQPVERSLQRAGVTIHTGARVQSFEDEDGLLRTQYEWNGETRSVRSGLVVLAVGRKPVTAGLGLARAGVHTDAKGFIPVDDALRTNVPGIYAIGDITGKQQLAHVASAQGIVAADTVCGIKRTMRYNAVPSCVYTSPELASVGLTEQQARAEGRAVRTGSFPVAANGRSMLLDEKDGVAKLVTDEMTGEILGAHLCAPRATDMIAELAVAMNAEATIEELAYTIHPHPTVSEIIMEAAHDAEGLCCHKP